MARNYLEPSYRIGAQFLSVDMGGNSALTGITDGQSTTISGTDPVAYVKERLAAIPTFSTGEAPGWLASLGKGIVGVMVGLILLAVGIWVVYRQ